MSNPAPGHPVRGSSTGRPIMAALDLLGRRWSLRVLWELWSSPGMSFRALQEACGGVSSSVLARRLQELRDAALLEVGDGYTLSPLGLALVSDLAPLQAWSQRWASELDGFGD